MLFEVSGETTWTDDELQVENDRMMTPSDPCASTQGQTETALS